MRKICRVECQKTVAFRRRFISGWVWKQSTQFSTSIQAARSCASAKGKTLVPPEKALRIQFLAFRSPAVTWPRAL